MTAEGTVGALLVFSNSYSAQSQHRVAAAAVGCRPKRQLLAPQPPHSEFRKSLPVAEGEGEMESGLCYGRDEDGNSTRSDFLLQRFYLLLLGEAGRIGQEREIMSVYRKSFFLLLSRLGLAWSEWVSG
jgi:hypothetical protein